MVLRPSVLETLGLHLSEHITHRAILIERLGVVEGAMTLHEVRVASPQAISGFQAAVIRISLVVGHEQNLLTPDRLHGKAAVPATDPPMQLISTS